MENIKVFPQVIYNENINAMCKKYHNSYQISHTSFRKLGQVWDNKYWNIKCEAEEKKC